MILIIDCTCQDHPLLRDEFVKPLENVVRKAGYLFRTISLAEKSNPGCVNGVILSGTAIRDHEFLKEGLPQWFDTYNGPVLGICAGMQLLTLSSGGSLIPDMKIGMAKIQVIGEDILFSGKESFEAWELHKSGVVVGNSCLVLATSQTGVRGFKMMDLPRYGVLFHPEVRNEWIIHNFLSLSSLSQGF